MPTITRDTRPVTFLAQAAGAAALLTTAQHLLLADAALGHEHRYMLGTATIVGCFALYTARVGRAADALPLLVIAGAAGIAPVTGYALRRRRAAVEAEGISRG